MQCIICAYNNINTVFLKCGHMVYCDKCMKEKKFDYCPICQIKSENIKTYMSGYNADPNDKNVSYNNKKNKKRINQTVMIQHLHLNHYVDYFVYNI